LKFKKHKTNAFGCTFANTHLPTLKSEIAKKTTKPAQKDRQKMPTKQMTEKE